MPNASLTVGRRPPTGATDRSFNERSMEESNRRVVAALATVHLAPTELARTFLLGEGVDADRVRVVGNPVLDAVRLAGVRPAPPAARRGVLLTAHRATNVDDPTRLAELVALVHGLAEEHGPVLFPVHPRTQSRLRAAGHWPVHADLRAGGGPGASASRSGVPSAVG